MILNLSVAHSADMEYLVRQSMNTGYQWASALVPPAYIAYIISRRGKGDLSLNRVLRATWAGGLAGVSDINFHYYGPQTPVQILRTGAAAAGGGAYLRYAYANEQTVRTKRIETLYDVRHGLLS